MASETEFKYITVQQAEPDDEVVFAGISGASASFAEGEDNREYSDESSDGKSHKHSYERGNPELFTSTQDNPKRTENYQSQKETSSRERVVKKAPKNPLEDTEYPETSLEDLQGIKMPFAQKLVILFAIVLIIVAIIYYLLVLK